MTASPASTLGVLQYASPTVLTSRPRTLLRMFFATAGKALVTFLIGVRLLIVGLGYAVLAAGIAVRFALALVALVLFFIGGVRWTTIKRRTLGAAEWVDGKVLGTIALFRRLTTPRSPSAAAAVAP